jgi:hypothetical protein
LARAAGLIRTRKRGKTKADSQRESVPKAIDTSARNRFDQGRRTEIGARSRAGDGAENEDVRFTEGASERLSGSREAR